MVMISLSRLADDMASFSMKGKNEMVVKLVDSLAMLSNVNSDLNQSRREAIKPELSNDFKQLCKPNTSSTLLFGEDLSQKLKDIELDNRAGVKLAQPQYTRGGYNSRPFTRGFRGRAIYYANQAI